MVCQSDLILIFVIPAQMAPQTEICFRTDRQCVFRNDVGWILGILLNHRLFIVVCTHDGLRVTMPVTISVLTGWIEAKRDFLEVRIRAKDFLYNAN